MISGSPSSESTCQNENNLENSSTEKKTEIGLRQGVEQTRLSSRGPCIEGAICPVTDLRARESRLEDWIVGQRSTCNHGLEDRRVAVHTTNLWETANQKINKHQDTSGEVVSV